MRKILFLISLCAVVGLCLYTTNTFAYQATELSDQELDQISAGGLSFNIDFDVIPLSGIEQALSKASSNGNNLGLLLTSGGSATLLSGNAQQNLSSLVNVIANNSIVAVMLNLTVNINSVVDNVINNNTLNLIF